MYVVRSKIGESAKLACARAVRGVYDATGKGPRALSLVRVPLAGW